MTATTLVRKIEIGSGKEIHRHLEIGNTVDGINKLPSETFNGVSSYLVASVVTGNQKKTKWFSQFDMNDADNFGCIYKN